MLNKVERALVAVGYDRRSYVLATDGRTTAYYADEGSNSAEDIGLLDASDLEPGLYLCTGIWKTEAWAPDYEAEENFDGEVECVLGGEAPLNYDMLLALLKMKPPPEHDITDWVEEPKQCQAQSIPGRSSFPGTTSSS